MSGWSVEEGAACIIRTVTYDGLGFSAESGLAVRELDRLPEGPAQVITMRSAARRSNRSEAAFLVRDFFVFHLIRGSWSSSSTRSVKRATAKAFR